MKKQKRFWVYPLMVLGLALMLISSCKKEEEKKVPVLTTAETTSITPRSPEAERNETIINGFGGGCLPIGR